MRILFILLFGVFLYSNELLNNIDNFSTKNIKIEELNKFLADEKDENNQNKLKINSEIKELKNEKNQILAVFPTLITPENLDKNILKDIKKTNNDKILQAVEQNFYECLLEIISYLNSKEEHKTDLKNLIDERIKTISNYTSDNQEVKIKINSYVELLTYLRLNTDIFTTNDIFKQLDTNKFLSKFNSYFPEEVNNYINPGKVIICTLIMLFIFLLKKLVLKIIFTIILRVFKKNHDDHSLQLLQKSTKPLIALFYIYGLWLCFLIAFYPAPIMTLILTLFGIINTMAFTWLLITILDGYGVIIISKIAKRSGKKEIINLMLKILYFIIVFIAILIILAKLGFDISAIIASLGIGGLAVALAAKDIIANFFASVLMLFDNSFSQSDWVEINGIEGTIVETGLRKTTIRTFDNCLVFIPNSTILNGNIKNYSKRKYGRRVRMSVGLTYDASTEQIQNFINDIKELLTSNNIIANENDDVFQHKNKNYYKQNLISVNDLEGFKSSIYVWLDDFAASSINVELYFYIKSVSAKQYYDEKSKILMEIMKIVEKNGLSFAFPSTSLYIEKLPDTTK